MKFLVDAQLPRRLANCLRQEGFVAGFQQFDFLEITRKAVISHV